MIQRFKLLFFFASIIATCISLSSCEEEDKPIISVPAVIENAPKANFTVERDFLKVTLDASTSENAEMYSWNFGDGSDGASGSTVKYTYEKDGDYNIILTVNNTSEEPKKGLVDTKTIEVKARRMLIEPTAGFSFVADGSKVTFTDTSVDAVSYEWDFGVDGVDTDVSTEKDPTFRFPESGDYMISLTVKSSDDLSNTFTETINIIKPLVEDPDVFNADFDKLPKSSGSDCSCSGWINKDLGDQGESTTANGSSVIKFDNDEADLAYQEIDVVEATRYTLTYTYGFKGDASTTSKLEVRVLSGGSYVDIKDVEADANNISFRTVNPPGNDDFITESISFDSGENTKISLVIRGIGGAGAPVDGKPYLWSNGDQEIRVDSVSVVLDTDPVPTNPIVFNNTFTKIPKSSGSDCTCSGWINKDLGDQGESTSISGNDVIKFDNDEADLAYQEIDVLPNTDYSLSHIYNFKGDASGTSQLEIRVLNGEGYVDIAEVENSSNNIVSEVLSFPGNNDNNTNKLFFNSGVNSKISIVIRGIGGSGPPSDGKPYLWSNGDQEVRVDDLILIAE